MLFCQQGRKTKYLPDVTKYIYICHSIYVTYNNVKWKYQGLRHELT